MPNPTGRWLNTMQWQCPKCSWVNASADEACQQCGASIRPPADEPARPPDPLDLISHPEPGVASPGLVELATKAVHTLTRVTRAKAMSLLGDGIRNSLAQRGERGDRAWQAITELPEDDRRAALGYLVDNLEEEGFALYRIDANGRS
jgi:hypothetical protein